jgi:hypothetical protein
MLSITRSQAQRLLTLFRQVLRAGPQTSALPVLFQADSSGLTVRCQGGDLAAAYHEPGGFSPETIVIPVEALKKCAGRGQAPVLIEDIGSGQVRVQWDMEGFTRSSEYQSPSPESLPTFPETPGQFESAEDRFLSSLHEAALTAADEPNRFTLNEVQLDGNTGEIVGTDGKQLLVVSGYHFPWPDKVRIPRLTVFDNRLLRNDGPAEVGSTAKHLCIRVENWTFYLGLNRSGRYPPVADVLASVAQNATRWLIDSADADQLRRALPRLPKGADGVSRLEVDLEEPVVLRAGVPGSGEETELVLYGSRVLGERMHFAVDPLYLWRAVELGFSEVRLRSPSTPLFCEDERRKYVWMPLLAPPGPPAPPVANDDRF